MAFKSRAAVLALCLLSAAAVFAVPVGVPAAHGQTASPPAAAPAGDAAPTGQVSGPQAGAPSTPASTAPRGVVPAPRYEFAPVAEGLQVSHEFSVLNQGDGPLEITGVKTG